METENFELIRNEIKQLRKEEKILFENLNNVQMNIKNLYKKFPSCFSCGRRTDPKQMLIATQEDVDDYFDKNEGYCGPEIGEYYCGC